MGSASFRWGGSRGKRTARSPTSAASLSPHRCRPTIARGDSMTRTRTSVLGATFFLLAGALALTLVAPDGTLLQRESGQAQARRRRRRCGEQGGAAGEGPVGGYEAYRLGDARTYPAAAIPPAIVKRAQTTFARIVKRDARFAKRHGRSLPRATAASGSSTGRRTYGVQPGVTAFSGATNVTASRITAMRGRPELHGRASAASGSDASGGGVWMTTTCSRRGPDLEAAGARTTSTRTRSAS